MKQYAAWLCFIPSRMVNVIKTPGDCDMITRCYPTSLTLTECWMTRGWSSYRAQPPMLIVDAFTRHPRRRELLLTTWRWPAEEYVRSTFCECTADGYTPTQSAAAAASEAAIKRLRGHAVSCCGAWWQARCGCGATTESTDERNIWLTNLAEPAVGSDVPQINRERK